jgi:cobalt-zinc-cadmium efflux system outer membrane protein
MMMAAAIAAVASACAQDRALRVAEQPSSASRRAAEMVDKEVRPADEPPVVRGAEPDPLPGMEARSAIPATSTTEITETDTALLPPRLTLEYLSNLAVENHPVLRRDRARITSAEGGAIQAGLYPNPEFNTNNPEVFAGRQSLFNAGIMQEFVVKGKRQLDRAAALRTVQQTELSLMQDRYALLTMVRNQFYQTLAAQVRVEVLQRMLTITQASLKTAQDREAPAGVGTKTEVLLLSVDYNKTLADLENARRILEGEQKQLAALVSSPGLVNGPVDGSLTIDPPTFDEQILNQFVTEQHPQVQISKIEIDKNKVLLKRAEAEPYPNITLGPSYQWGLTNGNDQYWLTITFPIPVSNRNQGNIQAARANINDSVEALGTVQLEMLRHVAEAYSRYRGALEQAQRYKTNLIPDSVKALRLSASGYRSGFVELAEYLQVQRTVIQTQKDYIDVLEALWTTATELAGLLQMEQFP